jgi:TonB family protein
MAVDLYFLRRAAQRWNMLLRRAGKTPDDEVLQKISKLVGFTLSGPHRAFNDTKLSALVMRARLSFAVAVAGLVLWAVTAAFVPALAQEIDSPRGAVLKAPTPVEVTWAFPRPAYRSGMSGNASVQFFIDAAGAPKTCSLIAETPPAQGFGKAAMKLVRFMTFAPPGTTSSSEAVVFSISFDAPGADRWPDFVRVPAAREVAGLWPPGITGTVSVG